MTPVPVITEQDARREVARAKRSLRYWNTRLDRTPSGYSTAIPGSKLSVEWLRVDEKRRGAERRVRAAEASLDAVQSQVPERTIGTGGTERTALRGTRVFT